MSKKVDQRVVEIQFDNKDFESNVSTTMSTLDKLNEKLKMDDAAKGLQNVDKAAKNVDLSSVTNAAEDTGRSFSALEVMGITALANITNAAVNAGRNLVNNLISPITQGGLQRALNIEQAGFMLDGLGIENRNKAAGSYEEIMNAVLGTAYSYDVAAKAASQLAASNIGVEESTVKMSNGQKRTVKYLNSDMTNALLGIAGVASMTGSSFEEISDIFTNVAGKGKVGTEDLNRMASRGLNAFATLGEQLGKTEGEIRDMVTKGQIDFKTFSDAMSAAYGSHAKDSTKMFTGALEDTKAALARIGADFFAPVLNSARDALNAFTPFVDAVHDVFGDSKTGFIGGATEGIENLSNKLQTLLHVATYSMKSVGDSNNLAGSTAQAALDLISSNEKIGKSSTELIHDIANVTGKDFDQLKSDIESGKYALYELEDALQKTTKKGSEASKIFTSSVQSVREDKLWKLVKISDAMGLSVKANNEVIERFKNYKVNNILDIIGESLGKTGEEVQDLIDNGTLGFDELNGILQDAVKNGIIAQDVYDKATKKIRTDKIVQDNQELLSLVNNTFYFVDAIRAVGNAIKLLAGGALKLVTPFLNVIVAYGKIAFELIGAILEGVAKVVRHITELGSGKSGTLFEKINKLTTKLIPSGELIGKIIDGIKKSFDNILPIIDKIWDTTGKLFKDVKEIFKTNVLPKIVNAFQSIKGSFSSFGKIVKENGLLKTIFTSLSNVFDHLSEIVPKVLREFANSKPFERIITNITIGVGNLVKHLSALGTRLGNTKAVKTISNLLIKIADNITTIIDSILKSKAVVAIMDTFFGILNTIIDTLSSIGDSFINVFFEYILGVIVDIIYLWNSCKAAFLDSSFFTSISKFITSVLGKSLGILSTILEKISGAFGKLTKNDTVNAILEKINTGILAVTNSIGKLFKKLHLGELLTTILDKASLAIGSIFDKISKGNGIDWLIDAIGRLFDNISKMFDGLANSDTVDHFDNVLSNLVTTLENLDKLSFDTLANKVSAFFTNGWGDIGANITEGLGEGILTGTSNVIEFIIGLAGSIIETFCDLLGIHSPSKVFYVLGGFIIAGLLAGIKDSKGKALGDVADLSKRLVEALVSAVEKLDPGALAVDALLGGALYTLFQLNKTAQMGLSPISNLGKAFKELTKAVKNLRIALQFEINSFAIANIGIAVLLLANSLKIISEIDDTKVQQTIILFGALLIGLYGLSYAASKMDNLGAGTAFTFLSIAATIWAFAKTMEKLGNMDPDKLEQAYLPLLVIFTMIGVLTMIAGEAGQAIGKVEKVVKAFGLVILSIAAVAISIGVSVVLIATALGMIAMIPTKKIDQVKDLLAGIAVTLGLTLFITVKYGKEVKNISKFFLSIGVLFLSIAFSMQMISLIRSDKIQQAILVTVGLLIAVGLLMLEASALTKKYGGKIGDYSGLFLGIAAVFASMAISVKVLSGIKDGLLKAMIALGFLTVFIGALMYATNLLYGGGDDIAEFGTMMVGIAKSLLIMTAAIAILSILNTGSMVVAGVVVAGILFVISLIVKNASNVENAKGTVMWMAIIVGAIAGCLFILSQMNLEKMLWATGSLLIIMGAVFGIFALINKMKIENGLVGKVIAMSVVLGLATAAIAVIASVTEADNALKIAKALAMVMGVMALVLAAITVAGVLGTAAIPGIIAMGVVLALVAVLIYAISEHAKEIENVLDNALPVFLKFADGIGEFFGRIVAKFINTKTEGTAQALTNFAKTIEPLGESADKISKFADAMKPIKDITTLITTNIASKLTDFGRGLKDMVGQITKIDDSKISDAKEKLSGVADSLGNLGGSIKKKAAKTKTDAANSGKDVIDALSGSLSNSNAVQSVSGSLDKLMGGVSDGFSNQNAIKIATNTGGNIINGFLSKITSYDSIQAMYRGGYNAVDSANRGGRAAADEHSPSKVWREIAEFCGAGFVIGMRNSERPVEKAAYNLGDRANTSLMGVVDKINEILGDGIDMTPVITPVLDTSGVSASVGKINSMLSNTKALSVSSNVNARVSKLDTIQNALGNIKDGLLGVANQNGNTYIVNGVTYDDGSNITNAVETLVKATVIEGRI